MKVNRLTTEKRIDTAANRALKIQSYGQGNDYPQRVREVVEASITGLACVNTYRKFIAGRGFRAPELYDLVVNDYGQRVDGLLDRCADDYATFGGFAIHVNYNANYEIVEAQHVPLEWIRFRELDENYEFDGVRVHPDWGKRYLALRPFKAKDIVDIHLFDPNPAEIAREVEEAGGWESYKGQVLYYSDKGEKTYPMPIFEAALTDMSSEEGLSNIAYRNIRHNFLPSGMLIDHDNTPDSEEQERQTKAELKEFQTDVNAGKMMYVNLRNGEQAPEFVPFAGKNLDKDYTESDERIPDRIGSAFVQPPILRAKDVGSNFGATAMREAYSFYNSVTESERAIIAECFRRVFERWHEPVNVDGDWAILPKAYDVEETLAERLGDNTQEVVNIVFDETKAEASKRAVLSVVYGLTDEEIDELLNTQQP